MDEATLKSTTRDALASLIDCAADRLAALEDRERELQARNDRLFGADHDRWNDPVVASLRDSIWIVSQHVKALRDDTTCPNGG